MPHRNTAISIRAISTRSTSIVPRLYRYRCCAYLQYPKGTRFVPAIRTSFYRIHPAVTQREHIIIRVYHRLMDCVPRVIVIDNTTLRFFVIILLSACDTPEQCSCQLINEAPQLSRLGSNRRPQIADPGVDARAHVACCPQSEALMDLAVFSRVVMR